MVYMDQQNLIQQDDQYMNKEIIMKDLTRSKNKNLSIKNDEISQIGKNKNGKIKDVYSKGKSIEIKIKK